ncbi:hypothetical protein FOA52_015729 [Chlamydomonas sp. UWO 241]|nr:hypothetical protein FOA52_015729 [Chlamydomonas sp. UWO 241]
MCYLGNNILQGSSGHNVADSYFQTCVVRGSFGDPALCVKAWDVTGQESLPIYSGYTLDQCAMKCDSDRSRCSYFVHTTNMLCVLKTLPFTFQSGHRTGPESSVDKVCFRTPPTKG